MSVADAARTWRQAGVSVIPVLDNATKKPAIRWAEYQARIPELGEVDQWWGNGRQYGIAVICGAISGNLEMTEVEGRAMTGESLDRIRSCMAEVGAAHIWAVLTEHGYMEMSPSGGIHFLYRISDHDVPGNTKIAQDGNQLVLAETRGEGGYVIVAPTTGLCHPSGEPWTLVKGDLGEVPNLTWDERCKLHLGLRLALDAAPASAALDVQPPVHIESRVPSPGASELWTGGLSPNDDFEAQTDWAEILEPHGWSLESRRGSERFWTRPGKDRRLGASATTGFSGDRDRLYVFSTSTQFDSETPYTKYMAYAVLNHGGDKRAATTALARLGFGAVQRRIDLPELQFSTEGAPRTYPANDSGNSLHLRDRVKGRYLYMSPEKEFYAWDGRVWAPDFRGLLVNEFQAMADEKATRADEKGDVRSSKWWTQAGNAGRIDSAVRLLTKQPGVTVMPEEMNRGARLLNVGNGILDLSTGILHPHDMEMRQTRLFGANFNPQAVCPEFEKFMAQVLPDEAMRSYVQRALGYSLLGDVDHRAMFLIYGPSGTGKSTLMETMRAVFADYGTTAPSGTFRDRSREGGPTNDLHGLRNKRFVTTSETAEGANFDENLLKRLTGRDSLQSRELYQANQEWVPECTLWLATNHPPKFNSDDDAIWRRAKLIPFTTQFLGATEIHDMARRMLVPEADGILNWLLQGLRDFLAVGLEEPEGVVESAKTLRAQSDSVIRFLDDMAAEQSLSLTPQGHVRVKDLYMLYQSWCTSSGERSLGSRRFLNRIESADRGISLTTVQGFSVFMGVERTFRAQLTEHP
jgi:P4 family phage/plasmid primase-like protien